jgi:hypothetical protein
MEVEPSRRRLMRQPFESWQDRFEECVLNQLLENLPRACVGILNRS